MNGTQIKCFLVMMVLAVLGFGPLSLTCLIGMAVVIARPRWFYALVQNLYRDAEGGQHAHWPKPRYNGFETTMARIECFLSLIVLLVLDIAPIPVTGLIGLYVILLRPPWFRRLVEKIYGGVRLPNYLEQDST